MATKIQICNLASIKLGAPLINDLTENSEHTKIINYVYDFMVLDVLEEHDWHFATERSSALALSSSSVIGWDYKYAKPSGALRIIELADEDDFLPDEPFEEEGLYVYCNVADAYCRYVNTVSDPASFSPLFVDALAWRIAAEAAYRVTGKREKAEEMWQGFARAIERARTKDFYSTARAGNSSYTDEIIAEGTV